MYNCIRQKKRKNWPNNQKGLSMDWKTWEGKW